MTIDKLPLKSKLAYGGLGAGISLPSQITFSAITFFYLERLGLNPELIGIAWMIFSIWNAINDPLFGFIGDRTKSEKYGRRIFYIRFGAPVYGVIFILCWFPFVDITNQIALFVNFLIVLFTFDTIFTILGLINFTLPAEMAMTEKERANLLVYGNVLNSIGLLISFILPIVLLTGNKALVDDSVFLVTMILVGIISAIILFICSFYLKENRYTQMETPLPVTKGIVETFKNKPFLIFEVSNFSFTLAQTILTMGILFYLDYVLVISGFIASIPLMIVFLVIFAFFIVFNKLVVRYGAKRTFIFSVLLTGLSFILLFFIGWNFGTAIIAFILIGIGMSGYMLTNQVIIADIVDYDETRTGKRRETTYSGINALLTKPAISLANWLFLTIISIFGFQKDIPQEYLAQLGILIGFALLPAIFLIIGAIPMFLYRLEGPEWLFKKKELIKIHEKKEMDYLNYLKEKGVSNREI